MTEGIEKALITVGGAIGVAVVTLIGTIISKRNKETRQPITISDSQDEPGAPIQRVNLNAPTAPVQQSLPTPKEAPLEVTDFTHHELADKIESAPPLLREKIQDSFVGLRVRWDGKLSGGHSSSGGNYIICLNGITPGGVYCEAVSADCQKLIALNEGAQLTVEGTIVRIGKYEATLKDCNFELPKQTPNQDGK